MEGAGRRSCEWVFPGCALSGDYLNPLALICLASSRSVEAADGPEATRGVEAACFPNTVVRAVCVPTPLFLVIVTLEKSRAPPLAGQNIANTELMFSRISQVARHLTRPLPNYAHTSAAAGSLSANRIMTSSSTPDERNSRTIHTAACLIIGDEVLGGKTVDTNSAFMAKFCFKLGMALKRIEVIADDEEEIVEAVRRMSTNYDFVVTSGGIGPTHDDITYQSIAKAFNLPLILHQGAYDKMKKLSKPHPSQPNFSWDEDSPALKAKLRMIELPIDESRDIKKQVLFPVEDLWVPIACINGNIHVLPGVPRLFEKLLDGMKPLILPRLTDPEGKGIHRILISTPQPESAVAPYLTELAERVEPKGVKVGSYPRWGKPRNTVTLVGRDLKFLESLVAEVEKNVDGKRVSVEGEDDVEVEAKDS